MRNTSTVLAGKGRGGHDDPTGDDHGARGGHGGGKGRGGHDDPTGHDAGDDHGAAAPAQSPTVLAGKGRGGHDDPGGDDNGGARGGHGGGKGRGGHDDPTGHDAGDDKGGQRGGHGADDGSTAAALAGVTDSHGSGGGGGGRIRGDDNANLLDGTANDDRIEGNGGADTINGLAGDDRLDGGDGDDQINAGSGGDRVDGGAGNDLIMSDNSASTDRADVRISDGLGDDVVTVLGNADTRVDIRSGAGADDISVDGADRLKLKDGAGADSIDISGDFGRAKIQLQGVEPAEGDVNDVDTIHLAADATFDRALRVDNFVTGDGGDVFDFADYLAANSSWDGVADPVAGGFVQLLQDGDDVLLQVDVDGGADGFQTVVIFGDSLADGFTDANLDLVV